MRSGGPRSRSAKWTAAGCLVVVALALGLDLSACGGGSPAATAKAPAVERAKASSEPPGGGGRCANQVGDFLDSMDALRTNLVAGVSYEQYVDEVQSIRATYHGIPVDRVALGCLKAAGTPGENGLNKYIEASNAWSDCIEVPGCESASIEPALQSKWRQASKLLSEAQQGLKRLQKHRTSS
jgi:hypothetical protein